MKSQQQRAVRDVYDGVGEHGSQAPRGLQLATGEQLARALGYPDAQLRAVPAEILDAFVGAAPLATLIHPSAAERVLDLGCGAGLDSYLLQQAGARVVAIEPSAPMLQRLLGSAPKLAGVRALAPQIPLRSAAFDYVLLNGVANLVADRDALVAELARLLKPGGTLLLADILALEPLPAELRQLPEAWAWCVAGAGEASDWRRALAANGFRPPQIDLLEPFPPLARALLRATRSASP